ncbi:MAG TPA: multidrug efflux SMR transporter [Thermoanaerobaculia bacterium]|nr:multidrug efflux SMR transporter [Thermoanaerobaculia bacterium]
MAWLCLIVAGLLEIVWAVVLKRTEGFTRPGPSLVTLFAMLTSFYLLSRSMRTLPTGTTYAVWVGIGAAGTTLIGLLFLGEPRTAWRLISLSLILLGVVGLRISAGQ